MRRSKKDKSGLKDRSSVKAETEKDSAPVKMREKKDSAADKHSKHRDSTVKRWFKHFTDVAKLYEVKDQPKYPRSKSTTGTTVLPPPTGVPTSESADTVSTILTEHPVEPPKSKSAENLGSLEAAEELEETELIQPEEVTVSTGVVLQPAQQHNNLNERLQQQENIIQRALAEKQRLMAEAFHLSYHDYSHVAELASEDQSKDDVSKNLLASIHQSDKLTVLVNNNLQSHTQSHDPNDNMPSSPDVDNSSGELRIWLPAQELVTITTNLSEQLRQLMLGMEHRFKEMKQQQSQLQSLQDQINMLRTSTSDSMVISPTSSRQDDDLHRQLTELHISELDISTQSSQFSNSPSGTPSNSRPVSFISVNSEVSEGFKPEEEHNTDSDEVALEDKPDREVSHSTDVSRSESGSSTHSHTHRTPPDDPHTVHTDDTAKLQIVEALSKDICDRVCLAEPSDQCEDTTDNVHSDTTPEDVASQDNSKEPIVVSKETLVKNFQTTHMVTSETQTYQTEARVTNFTEHIVAETVFAEEPMHSEATEGASVASVRPIVETVVAETVQSSDEHSEEDTQPLVDNQEAPPTTACMEMDCQTEMDPELLELIEAAQLAEEAREQDTESGSCDSDTEEETDEQTETEHTDIGKVDPEQNQEMDTVQLQSDSTQEHTDIDQVEQTDTAQVHTEQSDSTQEVVATESEQTEEHKT